MSVPTNRNRIRGIHERISKHIIVKSNEYQKLRYVDPAGIGRKLFILPREIFRLRVNQGEVSRGHSSGRNTSPEQKPGKASQNHEGLNDTGSKCCKEVQTTSLPALY